MFGWLRKRTVENTDDVGHRLGQEMEQERERKRIKGLKLQERMKADKDAESWRKLRGH